MRRPLIGTTVGALLLTGSIAVVAVTTPGAAAAEEATTLEDTVTDAVSTILDRLVEAGFITEEAATRIEGMLEDLPLFRVLQRDGSDAPDPDELHRQLPRIEDRLDQLRKRFENLDPENLPNLPKDGFNLDQLRKRFENLDPENLPNLPKDGFNLDQLRKRFENLDPENLPNLPKDGFNLDQLPRRFRDFDFRGNPDLRNQPDAPRIPGLLFGLLDGVTLDELRDAVDNGTVAEVIDPDAILDAATRQLDEAVDQGRITRDRADAMLERLAETLDAITSGDLGSLSFDLMGART